MLFLLCHTAPALHPVTAWARAGGWRANLRASAIPTPDEITAAQRANLGCPDYSDEMKATWKESQIDLTDEYLKIQGHPVMEAWEHPYMKRLAEIATSQGGRVLELGFGMSISANYIQSTGSCDEHWICEANAQVAERARKWGEEVARSEVYVKEGFSWDVSPKLESGTFDGILYDTYPISEGAANLHHRDFFDEAARLLKPGGIFTYFCNEDEDINDEERALLDAAGFDVTAEKVDVPTPDDCQYWRAKTIVAPTCIKRTSGAKMSAARTSGASMSAARNDGDEPQMYIDAMLAAPDAAVTTATNGVAAAPSLLVNSWTEWQPLEEIIVGRAEMSCVPNSEPAFEAKLRSSEHALIQLAGRKRDPSAIEKAEEEIQGLIDVLEAHGVKVRRPELIDWSQPVRTPDFEVPNGNTGAMPRDVLLTVGGEILEAPMSWRSRFFEYRAYRATLNDLFEKDPSFIWSAAPKPTMSDALYRSDFPHEARGDGADEPRRQLAARRVFCHTEAEPIFDAADVMRLGKDLFVCHSFTTNRKGYEWLRRHYNSRGLRVHFIDFPDDTAPMHLDVNFVPLNSNTMLLNPVRPPRPWVRTLLERNGWKVITGVSNGLGVAPLSQCSEWLALNVLSIDEKRVCVEAQETKLQELLASHGFEPIPVPLRSVAQFGGAFHCCTTDVRRKGKLESYFPHIDALEAAGKECNFAPFGAVAPEAYA